VTADYQCLQTKNYWPLCANFRRGTSDWSTGGARDRCACAQSGRRGRVSGQTTVCEERSETKRRQSSGSRLFLDKI